MKYKTILFDLDGTLTDPYEGITKSVAYALNKFKIKVEDRKNLIPFIGPPLLSSFMKFYNMSEEEALKAIDEYRVYFKDKGLFENKDYDGIEELLKELKDRGCTLIVATSKPEVFAVRILEKFNLSRYFDKIAGTKLDRPKDTKADVINYALESQKVVNRKTAVMVGDREHDIFGAKEAGLDSIGVLYGYGNSDEFKKAGATSIVKNVDELRDLLLNAE